MVIDYSLHTQKAVSRKHFRELRKSISNESRSLLDTALFSNTAALPQFQRADTVLCYYPVKDEPNILHLVKYALEEGKRIAFPVSHVEEKRLSFHEVTDISQLTVGAYGIPEPPKSAPEISDFSNSFCIVPALAFDKNGKRLGYGGGYYDRFLSEFNGIAAGLTYSYFFVESVPTEEHDASLDIIITEKGVSFLHG